VQGGSYTYKHKHTGILRCKVADTYKHTHTDKHAQSHAHSRRDECEDMWHPFRMGKYSCAAHIRRSLTLCNTVGNR